jgi:hypothetical protein
LLAIRQRSELATLSALATLATAIPIALTAELVGSRRSISTTLAAVLIRAGRSVGVSLPAILIWPWRAVRIRAALTVAEEGAAR